MYLDILIYTCITIISYCQKIYKDGWLAGILKDLFNAICQDQISACLFHKMLDSPTMLLPIISFNRCLIGHSQSGDHLMVLVCINYSTASRYLTNPIPYWYNKLQKIKLHIFRKKQIYMLQYIFMFESRH